MHMSVRGGEADAMGVWHMGPEYRFWRWFRTIPLLVVAVVGLLSLGISIAPGFVLRKVLFPVQHEEAILESSARHGIDPLLVCAVIKCESNWVENAESGAGAVGLMQVMPSTAETLAGWGYVDSWSYDPNNLTDPATGIEYGCACLQYLSENLDDTDQVIAAYNAGLGTVQDWMDGGMPDISDAITYPETRFYLIRVKESYDMYRRFYDANLQPI